MLALSLSLGVAHHREKACSECDEPAKLWFRLIILQRCRRDRLARVVERVAQ